MKEEADRTIQHGVRSIVIYLVSILCSFVSITLYAEDVQYKIGNPGTNITVWSGWNISTNLHIKIELKGRKLKQSNKLYQSRKKPRRRKTL